MADEKPAEEDAPAEKGGGLMSVLPLAVIAAAGTFGMVWFAAAPAPGPTDMAACPAGEHAEAKPEVDIAELEARAAKYVELDSLTVSLGADAGAKHLKITIVLGTPPDGAELTDVEFLRLRDQFLERLRTVDSALISDPKAMPALKRSLLAQARNTLGQDSVYSVLITDFLMK